MPYRSTALPLLTLSLALLLGGCANRDDQPGTPPANTAGQPQQGADNAFEQLRSQAQRGDMESQFKLGSFYFVGKPDAVQSANAPRKDLQQAEYWWKQAADRGHAEAAVSLAYLYTGRDNPEFSNPPAMLKYLNQSASRGNPMAQHILGNFYLRGIEGVPRDPDQARRLFQSACKQKYAPSCKALDSAPGS